MIDRAAQPLDQHLFGLCEILADHTDVLLHRVDGASSPGWADERDWSEYLLSLPEHTLQRAEEQGLLIADASNPRMPSGLRELLVRAHAYSRVPSLEVREELVGHDTRSINLRKRAQLAALLSVGVGLAGAVSRIVDIGAGRGHLTRLAAREWNKNALGIERDPALVSEAQSLAGTLGIQFVCLDALHDDLSLGPHDLAMGLHACGEVGDTLVQKSAEGRSHVMLVSCCPQKISARQRTPLSMLAQQSGLSLPREVLGLANMSHSPHGVELSLSATLEARVNRYALRVFLRSRGLNVEPGAEMQGLNRRRAYRGLEPLVASACAIRGLPLPGPAELVVCSAQAKEEYDRVRRLSLPRMALARVLELTIVLDRAVFLLERGYDVQVAELFAKNVSPRNLVIAARPSV